MSIKHHFVRLAEKIHGRKCCRCDNNRDGICNHSFPECWQTLSRPGFEPRQQKAPGDLSENEKHELGKIVESLKEASTTAQDAGLLGEDDQETDVTRRVRAALAARNIYEERTESGLLEDE